MAFCASHKYFFLDNSSHPFKEFLEIINIIKCHDFITDTTHMTHRRKMTLIALLNSYRELEFMPH